MTRTRRARPRKQTATNSVVLPDDSIDLDAIDALLGTSTREEKALEARFGTKKAQGRRKKDQDVDETEIEIEESSEDEESSLDSESEQEPSKSKTPPAKDPKRKPTDITTISSNDSSDNKKRREKRKPRTGGGKQTSPSLKEQSRIDAANGLKAQTDSIKTIAEQKNTIARLRAKSDQDRSEIRDLLGELEDMTQKHNQLEHEHGKLETENEKLKAALVHIRNNPEKFAKQVAGGSGGTKRKNSRNQIRNDLAEHGDQCPQVQSCILATSKEVVKTIYRVFKFINTDTQQQMFIDLMLDNLGLLDEVGKPTLIRDPTHTDEQKAAVEAARKQVVDGYASSWIHELNCHRTYVQVNAQTSKN
jgi:hypothetical protein